MIDLAQVHWKAMDLPGVRCTPRPNPNTSQCIEDYVVSKTGCKLPSKIGYYKDDVPICSNYEQFKIHSNLAEVLIFMDENQIFAETGCLPSCDKMVYELSAPKLYALNPYLPEKGT